MNIAKQIENQERIIALLESCDARLKCIDEKYTFKCTDDVSRSTLQEYLDAYIRQLNGIVNHLVLIEGFVKNAK